MRAASTAVVEHLIEGIDPFLPPLMLRCPPDFDPGPVASDFLLSMRSLAEGKIAAEAVVDIEVRLLDVPARTAVDRFAQPSFKRPYRVRRPGQIYDRSALRFDPMRGSVLWIDRRIALAGSSNYLANGFRPLVTHAAATRGTALLHAGLVEHDGLGILLPGAAFSGKSSLSVFATLAGARIVSDDLVLVALRAGQASGRAFRSGFLMRERTHRLLPLRMQEDAMPTTIGGVSKFAYSRSALGERAVTESGIDALVFPSIDAGATGHAGPGFQLEGLEKSMALQTLMSCVDATVLMLGLEAERAAVVAAIIRLARDRPCYRLVMAPSFLENPAASAGAVLQQIAERVRDARAPAQS